MPLRGPGQDQAGGRRETRFFAHGHMCYKYLMQIIDSRILLSDLKVMAEKRFGNLVKAVIDIERGIMAFDGELHADEEALLRPLSTRP